MLLALSATSCTSDADPAAGQGQPSVERTTSGSLPVLAADGLPEDYPRDQAPLVDGRVASFEHRDGAGNPGWTVLITTDASAPTALSQAVDLLQATGWTPVGHQPRSAPVRVLDGDQGRIIITASSQRDETALAYAVNLG